MGTVRLGLLVLYLAGTYFLSSYLRDHPPVPGQLSLLPPGGMGRLIITIWGPTLWIFPGVLWIGLLNLHWAHVLILSALLPLSVFSIFLALSGVFTSDNLARHLPQLLVTVGGVLGATLIALLWAVLGSEVRTARLALFCASLMLPALVSIWFLAIWSREVVLMPPDVTKPTREALAMILGYYSGMPKKVWFVEDGKVHTRIPGNAFGGIGPGLLVTEPENVVVLKTGAQVARVAGPGAVLTARGEVPFRVVDLRNQIRSTQVDAITRDGIEVQLPVSTAFRVARGHAEVKLGESWPYRTQSDVLQALFSEEVDPSGRSPLDANTAHPWEDLPVEIAAHRAEQAVSFYSLDQLYGGITDPDAAELEDDPLHALLKTHRRVEEALGLSPVPSLGAPLSRMTIGELVCRAVQKALKPRGFEILGGGIGQAPEPLNRGVTEQRVEAWKSRFITKVMDWHAGIERQRYEALGKIRQQARERILAEIIEETGQRLETADPELQRSFIAYHLLDSLIRIARSPDVQKMLPESALPTLEQVYKQVSTDDVSGGER